MIAEVRFSTVYKVVESVVAGWTVAWCGGEVGLIMSAGHSAGTVT